MSTGRPDPRTLIKDAELLAKATLEPSGRHFMSLYVPGSLYEVPFTLDQARWIKRAVEEFESECAFDDGRPTFGSERTHRATRPLMQGIKIGDVR